MEAREPVILLIFYEKENILSHSYFTLAETHLAMMLDRLLDGCNLREPCPVAP